jgi:uncharacterized membrane protein (UPF0127 family)
MQNLRFLLVFLVFVSFSCKKSQKNTVKPFEITFKKEGELVFLNKNDTLVQLDIEFAETDYEQQTGLMHRNSMETNQGMLFIYEDERPRPTFYMKNTKIPLDLIYIDSDLNVVEINKDAKPFDESTIKAYKPAQYVLEVNAGFADKYNITDSLSVSFQKLNP